MTTRRTLNMPRWAHRLMLAVMAAALVGVVVLVWAVISPGATVAVAGQTFKVREPRTDDEYRAGLAGVTDLDEARMLFRFTEPTVQDVWMDGVLIPLDIAWIADGHIVQVLRLEPCPSGDGCPSWESPGPVDALLEVPAGELPGDATGAPVKIRNW